MTKFHRMTAVEKLALFFETWEIRVTKGLSSPLDRPELTSLVAFAEWCDGQDKLSLKSAAKLTEDVARSVRTAKGSRK